MTKVSSDIEFELDKMNKDISSSRREVDETLKRGGIKHVVENNQISVDLKSHIERVDVHENQNPGRMRGSINTEDDIKDASFSSENGQKLFTYKIAHINVNGWHANNYKL